MSSVSIGPDGKRLPRGPADGVVPNFHSVMVGKADLYPKKHGTELGPHMEERTGYKGADV